MCAPTTHAFATNHSQVLCASNEAHDAVDPVVIPQGVPNGEPVSFEGYQRDPEAQINPKKKIFEQIAPDLRTNGGMRCCCHFCYTPRRRVNNCGHVGLGDDLWVPSMLGQLTQLLPGMMRFDWKRITPTSHSLYSSQRVL